VFRFRSNARRTVATLLLPLFSSLTLGAQSPARGIPPNPENPNAAALRDIERMPARDKARDHAAEEQREREFFERLTEFATTWNTLMKLCEKGVWNAKKAKQARKAFDRLVQSPGWVENAKDLPSVP
jgi:hypothetical protein